MKFLSLFAAILFSSSVTVANPNRWQQRANYEMSIDFDVKTHRFTGTQELTYYNNSPDTLFKVFYHLYFNAFQPGSMMDVRSRTIEDPDRRVRDRIFNLSDEEIGYQKILSLTQDKKPLSYQVVGTILEVTLDKPIRPGKKSVFRMEFEAQVPKQIRRSGRDNREGIDYTMTQWYPKMAEYDYEGWHSNPYVGREFHGVWSDFDVKITIDSSYVIGGTGYLKNAREIGHGYYDQSKLRRPNADKLTWHFEAPDVHDFAWAADPDYKHTTAQVPGGPELHFFYQPGENTAKWDSLAAPSIRLFEVMAETFGPYPWKQYSVIQGGDGGMEYPMCTMITGERSWGSLVGVTVHEVAHSWFQGLLATNESLYSWMDEGFTEFASDLVMADLFPKDGFIFQGAYNSYFRLVDSGLEEPMSTHADHYKTNRAYGSASYSKGNVAVVQLSYIMGEQVLFPAMKRYFNTWKFKHPNVTDFKRIMEKQSGMELDWYFEHWVNTTNTIDYSILSVTPTEGGKTRVVLQKLGDMPMPIDLAVIRKDDSADLFTIPLRIMRGEKTADAVYGDSSIQVLKDWPWTHPNYSFEIEIPFDQIKSLVIDPSNRLADVDKMNNFYPPIVNEEITFQTEGE